MATTMGVIHQGLFGSVVLGVSWTFLGAILGPSWRSWGHLGHLLEALLEPSWVGRPTGDTLSAWPAGCAGNELDFFGSVQAFKLFRARNRWQLI